MSVYSIQHWIKAKVSATVRQDYNLDTFLQILSLFGLAILAFGRLVREEKVDGHSSRLHCELQLVVFRGGRGDHLPRISDTIAALGIEERNGLKRVV